MYVKQKSNSIGRTYTTVLHSDRIHSIPKKQIELTCSFQTSTEYDSILWYSKVEHVPQCCLAIVYISYPKKQIELSCLFQTSHNIIVVVQKRRTYTTVLSSDSIPNK